MARSGPILGVLIAAKVKYCERGSTRMSRTAQGQISINVFYSKSAEGADKDD